MSYVVRGKQKYGKKKKRNFKKIVSKEGEKLGMMKPAILELK